jgi:hypothetical protein
MGDAVPRAARRGLLGRGALLVAGAATFGLIGRRDGASAPAPAPADAVAANVLRFVGQSWHSVAADRRPGELPQPGDRLAMYGELLGADGGKVGEFYSACFCVGAPFGPSPYAANNVELHTFNLAGGSITGMGTASAGENVYAVVGGTGQYAGAAGSYVARQRPFELGGDGTAEFVFTLTK